MIILGIETSCDETSAAIVKDGREVLSCAIYSQIAQHKPFGGVVPEIASRCHVEVLPNILREALQQAGLNWSDIDAVASTFGPGLASSLLTGFTAAKSLALRLNRPLIPVNHLEAHLYAVFLNPEVPEPESTMPMLSLLVSGGHTCLIEIQSLQDYRLIGQTIDDAAGEALDKGASLLQLGYPGGPIIEKTAAGRNETFTRFPLGTVRTMRTAALDPRLCFSFSGVKTSLKYYLQQHPETFTDGSLPDIAASYQQAILSALVSRFERALIKTGIKQASCGGGVACNKKLRAMLQQTAKRHHCKLYIAPPAFCTDNAAMVAGIAARKPRHNTDALQEDIHPALPIGQM